jgi:amino acid transporter
VSPALKRELGLRDLVLFNIAAVVGIRWLAAAAHTGPGSITLWILAAIFFFIPSALAVSALSASNPAEGGIYVWTKESSGDWHGFLCGWCYWLSTLFYFPNLILAGVGMAGYSLGLTENRAYVISASLVILWIALIMNLIGLAIGKWMANIGAVSTYAAGGLLMMLGAAVGLLHGSATPIHLLPDWSVGKLNFWSQIAFAFGGLELGAVMGGEIRNPTRTVPRAAWIAGLSIAAFYILGTLAMLIVLPADQISIVTGLVQGGYAAGARLGARWIAPALAMLLVLGVAGQLGTWVGGIARVPFVIGVDRYLPAAFGKIHPTWRTPYVAILTQGAACTFFVLALQIGEDLRVGYQLLVDMSTITYFIPFLYLFGASWRAGQSRSAACGIAVTSIAIVLSLIPTHDAASVWLFELKLIGGTVLLVVGARFCFDRAVLKESLQKRN